jgi:hypothetical protein
LHFRGRTLTGNAPAFLTTLARRSKHDNVILFDNIHQGRSASVGQPLNLIHLRADRQGGGLWKLSGRGEDAIRASMPGLNAPS